VVGWPPIRSYRKNTMATNQLKVSKEDAEAKPGQGFLYVKVSMDGAPYLRKIDLRTYKNYKDLSTALEKMFSGFSTGETSPAYLLSGFLRLLNTLFCLSF
jgi:auxin-responsive protein IAA